MPNTKQQFAVGIDLMGNPIINFTPNPLPSAPASAVPYYVYTNTTDNLIYQNVGTLSAPVWRPVGAVLSVNGKVGAVVLTQDDVGDGENYVRTHNDLTDALKAQITTNADDIDDLQALVPSAASAQNQLADKDFVTDSITQSTAFFRGSFATKAALDAVAWQTSDPAAPYFVSNNDYAYVEADETHNGECWRYIYVNEEGGQNNGWQAQIRVNEGPLTAAQLAAINSGITAAGVAQINSNTVAISQTLAMIANVESATASTDYAVGDLLISGGVLYEVTGAIATGAAITPGSNVTATTLEAQLAKKQTLLTFDTTPTLNSSNPVTSDGIARAMAQAAAGSVLLASGTIGTSATSVVVPYSGTLINAYAVMGGAVVIVDIAIGAGSVTFSTAAAPSSAVTCMVLYTPASA